MKLTIDTLIVKSVENFIKTLPIYKYFNFSYHTQKHKLTDILYAIIYILKTGLPWYHIDNISDINYKTVYKAFRKLSLLNVFKNTYIDMLKVYVKRAPNKKLKLQYVDSTIIGNKYGSEKIGRSKFYKSKYTTKLSFITDAYGKPIYVNLEGGNKYDSKIIVENYNNFLIDKDLNNEYKKYFLGDKGYCSKQLRNILEDDNYVPIIDFNNRNTKDKTKIKKLSKDEFKIYKKRIMIEYTFGKLKKNFRRIDLRYDKCISTFESFVYMALIWLLKN